MPFVMTESLIFIVYRTAMKLRTEMMRRLKPFGITPEQFLILDCLAEQDGVSQRELVLPSQLGIYEYEGEHRWKSHTSKTAAKFFYIGMWS